MFCNKCGKEIGDDTKFCNNCGYKFELPKNTDKKKAKEEYVWTCDYCGKEFDTELESDNHEKECDKNPNIIKDSSVIYCPKCGIENANKAKFCKGCGKDLTSEITINNDETKKKNSKPGLTGWLAIIGLGLIIAFFRQGYELLQFLPVLSTTYDIPGFTSLLQYEFVGSLAYLVIIVYTLYLYFKKNVKFPKYYIIFLIYPIIFSVIDLIWLGALSFPAQEIKQVMDESMTKASGELLQGVIGGIVWGIYMFKSKQVKITFINEN